MFERLSKDCADAEVLNEHLRMFANEGLRTLVLARKTITDAEYQAWRTYVCQRLSRAVTIIMTMSMVILLVLMIMVMIIDC